MANFNKKNNNNGEDQEFRKFYLIFTPDHSQDLTDQVSVDPIWNDENDSEVPDQFLVSMDGDDHFEQRRFPFEEGELYRANFNSPGRMPYITKMELKGSVSEKLAFIMGFKPSMKDQEIEADYYCLTHGGVIFAYEVRRKNYGNTKLIPRAFSIDEENLQPGLGKELVKWGIDPKFPKEWLITHFPEVFGELADEKDETLVDPLLPEEITTEE